MENYWSWTIAESFKPRNLHHCGTPSLTSLLHLNNSYNYPTWYYEIALSHSEGLTSLCIKYGKFFFKIFAQLHRKQPDTKLAHYWLICIRKEKRREFMRWWFCTTKTMILYVFLLKNDFKNVQQNKKLIDSELKWFLGITVWCSSSYYFLEQLSTINQSIACWNNVLAVKEDQNKKLKWYYWL